MTRYCEISLTGLVAMSGLPCGVYGECAASLFWKRELEIWESRVSIFSHLAPYLPHLPRLPQHSEEQNQRRGRAVTQQHTRPA